MSMILGNAFSLQMLDGDFSNLSISIISKTEVKELLAKGFVSAIGHEDTARVLSEVLNTTVEMNRVNITLDDSATLLVAQLTGGRLPEGSIELPPGFTFKFMKVTLNKVSLDPYMMGKKVLESAGYEVSCAGFGYSSQEITTKKDGQVIYRETIGE